MTVRRLLATGAGAVLLLSSCGGGNDTESNTSTSSSSDEQSAGSASAEQVAKDQRGDVDCPAEVRQARDPGAPVDDVVGVRPGMTWDEARNFVLCDNPLLVLTENKNRTFSLNLYGATVRHGFDAKFAEARVEKSGKEIMADMQRDFNRRQNNAREDPLRPGQVRYYVGTMGMPRQEQVISVAREEYFPKDKLPPVNSVEQALVAKYGPPTAITDNPKFKSINWKFDPSGRRITETSPLYGRCNTSASPDAGSSLSPDCGVSVSAQIGAAESNPGLARSLAVSSQNGAEGYALLERTQNELAAADSARRANELKDAEQSADTPKL